MTDKPDQTDLETDPYHQADLQAPDAGDDGAQSTRPNGNSNELDISTREADVAEPSAEIIRRGGTFSSFRHRAYALFWSGALVSNVGTWMQNYALGIVVYAFRRSSFDLGFVNFIAGIPALILALPAGVLADRVDKRRLIIGAQVVLLVQAAMLGFLYNSGRLSSANALASLGWVATLGLIAGVMSALTFPAWQAFLPDLVPRRLLLNAIALNSAQFQSSRLLGPLLAGALVVAGAGMGEIFYVNAISFLFVIAALWAIRHPLRRGRSAGHAVPEGTAAGATDPPHDNASGMSAGRGPATAASQPGTLPGRPPSGDARQGSIRTLLAGIRYARDNTAIGILVASTAVVTVFGFPYMTLLPAIVNRTLGFPEGSAIYNRGIAFVMAANGLGALFGALTVASLPHTVKRERIIPFTIAGFAVALIGFALSRSLWLTMAFSLVAGIGILATNSLTNTSIQAAVPGHLRGRVMALFVLSFLGLMPISGLVFGSIGNVIGPSNAVLLGALVLSLWAVLLVFRPSMITPRELPDLAEATG